MMEALPRPDKANRAVRPASPHRDRERRNAEESAAHVSERRLKAERRNPRPMRIHDFPARINETPTDRLELTTRGLYVVYAQTVTFDA